MMDKIRMKINIHLHDLHNSSLSSTIYSSYSSYHISNKNIYSECFYFLFFYCSKYKNIKENSFSKHQQYTWLPL